MLLSGPGDVAAAETASREYQLKAAFLSNFTRFIEWPAQRFADESSPIVIGVFGQNPFGGELEKIVKGRAVNGRAVLVKLVHTAAEVLAVHLLFVPAGEETHLPAVVWRDRAIVTVGESEAFAARGGVITFTHEGDRLRFEINLSSARRNQPQISAQLQKLATVVRRNP